MSNVSNLLQKSSKHSTYVSETNGNTKDTSEWRINYFVDKIFCPAWSASNVIRDDLLWQSYITCRRERPK